MRKLEKNEIYFWNNTSISILIDCNFTLEINDGLIIGLETEGSKNVQNEG